VALELGLTSWRKVSHGGVGYYVGYASDLAGYACVQVQEKKLKVTPFASGSTFSLIMAADEEAFCGLVVDSGGNLAVDVPVDANGAARVFWSKDGGETWLEVSA
jgi:hypothetical protein